jgi:hypothetical protein
MDMRQLQMFTTAELAVMRDRSASRNYSPAAEEFRREHERHRAWGLARRHAERLRRVRDNPRDTQERHPAEDCRPVQTQSQNVSHPRRPASGERTRCSASSSTGRAEANPPTALSSPDHRSGQVTSPKPMLATGEARPAPPPGDRRLAPVGTRQSAPAGVHRPGPSTNHHPGPSANHQPRPRPNHQPRPCANHQPRPSANHQLEAARKRSARLREKRQSGPNDQGSSPGIPSISTPHAVLTSRQWNRHLLARPKVTQKISEIRSYKGDAQRHQRGTTNPEKRNRGPPSHGRSAIGTFAGRPGGSNIACQVHIFLDRWAWHEARRIAALRSRLQPRCIDEPWDAPPKSGREDPGRGD